MVVRAKFATEPTQKIIEYQIYPPENDQVKIAMNVSRWHQEEILKKLTEKNTENDFSDAKAVNTEHPKYPNSGILNYTIEITVPKDKVIAFVKAATNIEEPFYQLNKEQLEGIEYKFPASSNQSTATLSKKY
jgi:hypothetical protein